MVQPILLIIELLQLENVSYFLVYNFSGIWLFQFDSFDKNY